MNRRRAAPGLVTIYWRDIPAQVTASAAGIQEKVMLEPRFQRAIDRAAHVAGLTDTHSYVEQWRRTATPVDGDPAEAARTEAAALEHHYPHDRLEALVANGGLDPDGGSSAT